MNPLFAATAFAALAFCCFCAAERFFLVCRRREIDALFWLSFATTVAFGSAGALFSFTAAIQASLCIDLLFRSS